MLVLATALLLATEAPPPLSPEDARVVEMLREANVTVYDPRCFRRPSAFEGVVVIGGYDRENARCFGTRKVVVGESLTDVDTASKDLLARAGWADADRPRRSALVLEWIREIRLPFETMVAAPTPYFGGRYSPAFVPPQIALSHDGGVEVVAWFEIPDKRRASYERRRIAVASDGAATIESLVRCSAPREAQP